VTTAPARIRFRRSSAISVAAVIMIIAGASLATWAPYLLPILLVPLAVAVWAWRSGTDVDKTGLTVRAAVGSRHVPWSTVSDLVTSPDGKVSAHLTSGRAIDLPAVTRADVPKLVAAAGATITRNNPGGPGDPDPAS
jgi:hypothetical protein